jgi:hypothetical protein
MSYGTQEYPTTEILSKSQTHPTQTFTPSLFRALEFQMQEKVKALKMSVAGFGLTQKELLGKIDLNTLSLRTAQYLLDEAWREYSQDLPKSGMMRSGVVYRAINSVSNNTVKGYILLPTPIKHDAKCSVRTDQYFGNLNRKLFRNLAEFLRDGPTDGKYPNPVLSEVLMTFPPLYTDLSASVTRSYL